MVLRASTTAAPALTAIQGASSSQAALKAIEQDKTLTLDFDASASQSPTLVGVEGWTYLQLFGKEPGADPYATITDTIDTARLAGWAGNLASAHITIWLNPALFGTEDTAQARQGRMIGVALHEWELHARALYDFYKELRGVQTAVSDTALAQLTAYVKAGVYLARAQHSAPELRSAQILAAFRLACARVTADMRPTSGSKRKDADPELDSASIEYSVLMTTRRDALGTGTGLSLEAAKLAYAGGLARLQTQYGKDVVQEVLNQFEMED